MEDWEKKLIIDGLKRLLDEYSMEKFTKALINLREVERE